MGGWFGFDGESSCSFQVDTLEVLEADGDLVSIVICLVLERRLTRDGSRVDGKELVEMVSERMYRIQDEIYEEDRSGKFYSLIISGRFFKVNNRRGLACITHIIRESAAVNP